MNTNIEHRTHDVQPTDKPIWRDRIAMPATGSDLVAELRVVVPGAVALQDTCALVAGPTGGSGYRTAMTDAGTVAFPGTPAWSPPI